MWQFSLQNRVNQIGVSRTLSMWRYFLQDMKYSVLMLESGSTIISVFYYVCPGELRWTRGRDEVYAGPEHPLLYWKVEVPRKNCHREYLETSPNKFCDLHSLKHFKVNYCEKLRLSCCEPNRAISILPNLQSVNLCRCSRTQLGTSRAFKV